MKSDYANFSKSTYKKKNIKSGIEGKNSRLSIRIPKSLNERINDMINLVPTKIKDRSDFGRKAVNLYLKQLQIIFSEYELIIDALKIISKAKNIFLEDLEHLYKKRWADFDVNYDLLILI